MDARGVPDPDKPLVSFGIIADVQYANAPDAMNYRKTQMRYYRNSLKQLTTAIDTWNDHKQEVSFTLQLGDIIDGLNRNRKTSAQALEDVFQSLSHFKKLVYHICGNHEFYNFRREELAVTRLNSSRLLCPGISNGDREKTSGHESFYYHFSPCEGFRIVVLDTYEVSMLGYNHDSKLYKEAETLLRSHNPNKELNSSDGMRGKNKRFVKYNGALSQEQLRWLDAVLVEADKNEESVLVAGHNPMYEHSSRPSCLCWNYEDVLDVLRRHMCVKAYMCGHDHDGGYAQDDTGIFHITLPGVIETDPEMDCFGVVQVYQDKLIISGYGRLENFTFMFTERQKNIG